MCFFIVCFFILSSVFFYISLLYVFIGVSYSGLSLFVRIIMINHQENLLKAIELSQKSVNNGSSPFGAIIADAQGNIIGEGHNRVVLDNDPTAHGEVMAIRNACKNINSFDLSGCTLYTSCEPCPMCLNAAKWANIKEIYYAADRFDAESIGFRDRVFYEDDPVNLHRIELKEAVDIMNMWKNKADKIEY